MTSERATIHDAYSDPNAAFDEMHCRCERFDRFSLSVDSRNCPIHRGSTSSDSRGGERG